MKLFLLFIIIILFGIFLIYQTTTNNKSTTKRKYLRKNEQEVEDKCIKPCYTLTNGSSNKIVKVNNDGSICYINNKIKNSLLYNNKEFKNLLIQ